MPANPSTNLLAPIAGRLLRRNRHQARRPKADWPETGSQGARPEGAPCAPAARALPVRAAAPTPWLRAEPFQGGVRAAVAALLACLLLGMGGAEAAEAGPQSPPAVFYGLYDGPQPCRVHALRPERWQGLPEPGVSDYQRFNRQTLRSLVCPVQRAQGSDAPLSWALGVLQQWAKANAGEQPASPWAWAEHAVAWRAVVIAYLEHAARASAPASGQLELLTRMAERHGRHLARSSVYRPHHNHGLNNALGLLALGVTFAEHPQSQRWVELGLARAEQQMAANVSEDGIHLEQSGFYHFYTLRSFLEIFRVAQLVGRPMSADYAASLDRMLGAAARMAGTDGQVEGLPYSDPEQQLLPDFLRGIEALDGAGGGSGLAVYRAVAAGRPPETLALYEQGGYGFFPPRTGTQTELVFHTRILQAPHGHQDALGVTVALDGRPLVVMPSTMHTGPESWTSYFLGPTAHNTVQVDDLQQQPLNRRRDGWIATFFDSYKINRWVTAVGLEDVFTRSRRWLGMGRKSLRERAAPINGVILAHGDTPSLQYVTARQQTYPGIDHVRTLARIGPGIVLVWDRLASDRPRRFTQSFHFPVGARIDWQEGSGMVRAAPDLSAGFSHLGAEQREVCIGRKAPQRCGWYAASSAAPVPAPALRYSRSARAAEFLRALSPGGPAPALDWRRGPGGAASVSVTLGSCRIRLARESARLRLDAVEGCSEPAAAGQAAGGEP